MANVVLPHGVSAHTLEANITQIPQIIPLTSDTPRLCQRVSHSPVARRHANALSTKERRVAARSAQTVEANVTMPQITPLTSDTPRLRQPVSRSSVARRRANTLPAEIPMALRRHERRVATWCAQTLEANVSHDATNHPAHQRHAAFTPACFALPSGMVPRKHTSRPGRGNPNGAATWRTSCCHTVCPHT